MITDHKIKKTLSIPITCPHKYYLPLLNVEVSWSIEGAQIHFATFSVPFLISTVVQQYPVKQK